MDFRQRRKIDTHIDMTPMIDTLLQLFVVFMLNMSFLASAVHLELPKASADQAAPSAAIAVSLDASGQVFVNTEMVGRTNLLGRLRDELAKGKDGKVVLRADRALRYDQVLDALVIITQAGAAQVSLAYEGKEVR
jgi:biopolymer transport protein ExbD